MTSIYWKSRQTLYVRSLESIHNSEQVFIGRNTETSLLGCLEDALTNLDHQAKILGMMNSRQDDPLQSSSLSTYIGYITGPRAEQPIGVRVVEPPQGTRQHQRGSLYAVIEVMGDHPDRAAIVDRLLSEVQTRLLLGKG